MGKTRWATNKKEYLVCHLLQNGLEKNKNDNGTEKLKRRISTTRQLTLADIKGILKCGGSK